MPESCETFTLWFPWTVLSNRRLYQYKSKYLQYKYSEICSAAYSAVKSKNSCKVLIFKAQKTLKIE